MKNLKTRRVLKLTLVYFFLMISSVINAQDFPSSYKGFNFGWWGRTNSSDAVAVKEIGANTVRLVFRWYREVGKNDDSYNANGTANNGYIKNSYLNELDNEIQWLSDNNINIILTVEAGGGSLREQNFWNNDFIKNRYIELWKFLINRYKKNENIKAWELLSEPHPNKYYGSNFPHSRIRDFYIDVISSLLSTATESKPFVIGPQFYYKAKYLVDDLIIHDTSIKTRVVYTFNVLVHEGQDGSYSALQETVNLATTFRDKHNVKIFCNQVGCELTVLNSSTIRKNMIDLLNENEIPWTYWNWRGGVFNVRKLDGSYENTVRNFFKDNGVFSSDLSVEPEPVEESIIPIVSPNPTDSTITIAAKGFESVYLKSIEGKLLTTYNTNAIDLSFLKPGVYIATIKTTEGIFQKKIIKL
ncbi:cellulase family glycosylhydrolase [Wenyingzhuangia sp. IMCC45574]